MPRLDTYVSQGSVAHTTGQPEIPASLGTQHALIAGSEAVAGELAHTVYLDAMKAKAQEVSEQTTAGAQMLLNVDQQVRDFGNALSDPSVTTPPAAKKEYFTQRVKEMEQEALAEAAKRGGVTQQYVTTHLRTITDPHLLAFDKHMTKLREEDGQLNFIQSTQANIDRVVPLSPEEQAQAVTDLFRNAHTAVTAGFLTGEQAATFANNEVKRLKNETNVAKIRQDPENFLRTAPQGTPPESMEAARSQLSLNNSKEDRTRQETERWTKKQEDDNQLLGERMVSVGAINNADDLLAFHAGQGGLLSATGFHTLYVMVKNKQEQIHSDPDTLASFYTRLRSFNPKDWPKEGEVEHFMDSKFGSPKLSTEHGISLMKEIRTVQDEFRKEGMTTYRQEASDGKEEIKTYFAAGKGSMLDYDKVFGYWEAKALEAYDNHVLRERDNPARKGSPLQWTRDVVFPYIVAATQAERTLLTSDLMRLPLPPDANTQDQVLALRKAGKIDPDTAQRAIRDLQLIDTIALIEQAHEIKRVTEAAGKTDTTGVKRNR